MLSIASSFYETTTMNHTNRCVDPQEKIWTHSQHNSMEQTMAERSSATTKSSLPVRSYSKRDILSGRGGLANKHFGNRVYRRLIKHNKDLYRRLKSKRKQNLLIKSILLAVESQGGRFLKEDKKSNTWFEIDPKDAWAKTSQALREPDKKSGDDESEDGQCSEPTNSTSSKRKRTTEMPVVEVPKPTKLTRQYTTDDPPKADRHIFDQLPENLDYEDEAGEEDMKVAPALFQANTSTFSLLAFDHDHHPKPQEISVPRPYRQQQQQQQQPQPLLHCNDFSLPPSFSRETTSLVARQALGMRLTSTDSCDFLRAAPLMRLDTIGTFASPPGFQSTNNTHNTLHCAVNNSVQVAPPPPPPPLLTYTSSAFLRGLDEVMLQREESTASMDFSSFVGGIAPV